MNDTQSEKDEKSRIYRLNRLFEYNEKQVVPSTAGTLNGGALFPYWKFNNSTIAIIGKTRYTYIWLYYHDNILEMQMTGICYYFKMAEVA